MTVPAIAGSVVSARSGDEDAPLVVLGPSLGTTAALWADVAERLAVDHRVLAFDLPGHGSSSPTELPFSIEELADAVVALVDDVLVEQPGGTNFYYSGDSLGGAIGLTLAVRHPERLLGLVTFGAAARFATPDAWRDRAQLVREQGMAPIRAISEARWFPPGWVEKHPERAALVLDEQADIDAESYALCCDAVGRYDLALTARNIRASATCVVGEFDFAAPPEDVRALASEIPGGTFVVLPGAGHVPVFEQPAESERVLRSALRVKGS